MYFVRGDREETKRVRIKRLRVFMAKRDWNYKLNVESAIRHLKLHRIAQDRISVCLSQASVNAGMLKRKLKVCSKMSVKHRRECHSKNSLVRFNQILSFKEEDKVACYYSWSSICASLWLTIWLFCIILYKLIIMIITVFSVDPMFSLLVLLWS